MCVTSPAHQKEASAAIHKAKKHKQDKEQSFSGTLAAEKVKVCKLAAQQQHRPVISCSDNQLKNVFKFKYLGTIFSSDAKQNYDVKARIEKAFIRCGKLRNVLDAKALSVKLKLRLYQATVCSILTYGCETWRITPQVM